MTYYDELGLPDSASLDDIRESYRQLARLLHPDKLQDQRQRHIAECQMKRLNCIYETLSNSERRAQYDESLAGAAVATAQESHTRLRALWRPPQSVWLAAGALLVAAVVLALSFRDSRPSGNWEPEKPVEPVSVPGADREPDRANGRIFSQNRFQPNTQVLSLRRQLDQSRAETDSARKEIAGLRRQVAELEQRVSTNAPAVVAQPELPRMPLLEVPRLPQPPATLAGTWYYPRTQVNPSAKDLYPPEFIEAVILEENGALRGRYRARYRVADRAISPDVAFHFAGERQTVSAHLPWLGAGGARGEVSLKLLSENTLEIAWVARDLGKAQGLGSGIAVLMRRQDP
jgi:curved DNA-binding protein CbpA